MFGVRVSLAVVFEAARRYRLIAGLLASLLLLLGLTSARSRAIPAPPPPKDALAVLRSRVAWFDGQHARMTSFSGTPLGSAPLPEAGLFGPYVAVGSPDRVALEASGRLFAGTPPGHVAGIPARSVGCWLATPSVLRSWFAVVGHVLVTGASSGCIGSASGPQPLFARSLTGGRWRILRRLPGNAPPILAVNGHTLAVGIQLSLRRMHVLLIEMPGDRVRGAVDLPDGMLAFAGPRRLVVSRRGGAPFPIWPEVELAGGGTISGGSIGSGPFHSALYTTTGRRLSDLGTSTQQPLVSGDHMITVSSDLASGTDVVTERSLSSGRSMSIIGFSNPGRTLLASALRWPHLAMIETTSTALPNGQFTCRYGTYTAPSPPFVQIINLAPAPRFNPAPIAPPQPTAQQFFARCGPPPP